MVGRKRMIAAAMFFIATSLATIAQTGARMSLPAPSGPYGIGRVAYAMTDDNRSELLSQVPGARRKVMIFVWYPTDREATSRQKSAPYLPGFDKALPKLSAGDLNSMFQPSKFRDVESLPSIPVAGAAPIAGGRQRFPLLLFSHGWGNPTFLYTAELADIVSHGYIVVAVDHPYDTAYALFPDGDLVLFAQDRRAATGQRVGEGYRTCEAG